MKRILKKIILAFLALCSYVFPMSIPAVLVAELLKCLPHALKIGLMILYPYVYDGRALDQIKIEPVSDRQTSQNDPFITRYKTNDEFINEILSQVNRRRANQKAQQPHLPSVDALHSQFKHAQNVEMPSSEISFAYTHTQQQPTTQTILRADANTGTKQENKEFFTPAVAQQIVQEVFVHSRNPAYSTMHREMERQISHQIHQTRAENYQALEQIAKNPHMLLRFTKEQQAVLKALHECSSNKLAPVLRAVNLLIQHEQYLQQMASVPFIDQNLKQSAEELIRSYCTDDGRFQSRIAANNTQLAEIALKFLLGYEHSDVQLKVALKHLIEINYPGAQHLANLIEVERHRSIWERFTDGISNFLTRFSETPWLSSSTSAQKVKNHPFNKDLFAMCEYVAQGKWDDLENVLKKYAERAATRSQIDLQNFTTAKDLFDEIACARWLYKKYQLDPVYQYFVQQDVSKSDAQDLNQILHLRSQAQQKIMHELKLPDTAYAQAIAYDMVSLLHDPVRLCFYLSEISSDHPQKHIRELYPYFYDTQGVLRITSYDSLQIKEAGIPSNIGIHTLNAHRALLNILLKVDCKNDQVRQQIDQGLRYVACATQDTQLAESYLKIANASVKALIDQSADDTILHCGDFTDMDDEILQAALVVQTADVVTELNKPGVYPGIVKKLRDSLVEIEEARAFFNGEFEPFIYSQDSLPDQPKNKPPLNNQQPSQEDPEKPKKEDDPEKLVGAAAGAKTADELRKQSQKNNRQSRGASRAGKSQPQQTSADSNKIVTSVDVPNGNVVNKIELRQKNYNHSFSPQHIKDGLLNASNKLTDAEKKADLIDKAIKIIKDADQKGCIKNGLVRLETIINNEKLTFGVYTQNGKVIGCDIFPKFSARKLNTIFFEWIE